MATAPVPDIKGQSGLKTLFSFPHPVNEYAARSVAAMVFMLTVLIMITGMHYLMFLLAYGFLARVLTGPKLSPMGLLATRVIAPKILKKSRAVAGPPKQFAQTVGLVFSSTALVLTYAFGTITLAYLLLSILALFAALEAFAGFCAGCFVFGYLMRWGLIPPETCERCNNLNLRATAETPSQA